LKGLTKIEEILLVTIRRLKDQAYRAKIRQPRLRPAPPGILRRPWTGPIRP